MSDKLQRYIVERAGDGCGYTTWDGLDKNHQRMCLTEDVEKLETKCEAQARVIELMERNYEMTGKPYLIEDGKKVLEKRSLDIKEDWPPNKFLNSDRKEVKSV